MKRTIRRASLVLALSLVIGGVGWSAPKGAGFPQRPIELVIPFGAGGASDITGRQVAKIAEKYISQSIKCINKAGGGTVEGLSYVYNQPADGYTILAITPSLIISEVLQKSSIKFRANFDPLISVMKDIVVVGVSSKSQFKNAKSLLDYAKQNPGKLKIAGISPGGFDDFIASSFANDAGIQWTYVPYKSGSAIKAAVLGGEIAVYQDKIVSCLPLIQSGDIRPLIVINEQRLTSVPELKEIPCTKEMGIALTTGPWRGFSIKKGTPEDVKKYLIAVFEKVNKDPEFNKIKEKEMTNLKEGYMSSETFKKVWDEEYALYLDIFKKRGLVK
jgi:putative tricarboxylic transport membrane protein